MSEKFKNKYRIASNRWQYWDYSAPGSYFITICIPKREHILGSIIDDQMQLSTYGEIVENEFQNLATYHPRASVDAYIVMPNHVHCLVSLDDWADGRTDVEKIHEFSLPKSIQSQPSIGTTIPPWWHDLRHQPTVEQVKQYRRMRRKMLIPKMMGKFQMLTSKQMNLLRGTPGHKNWQANYHDHVVRNEASWQRIKNYILSNPDNWADDTFYSTGK